MTGSSAGAAGQRRVEIRRGTDGDRDALAAMWSEAGLELPADDEWRTLTGSDAFVVLVAMHGSEVAGAAVASFDGWRAYLYHVAVAPGHRRQGIGRQLVEEAERRLRATGARRLYATIGEDQVDGLVLMGSLGYVPDGELIVGKSLDEPR